MIMAKNKLGFILPPGKRFTGASALNRDIYSNLKKEINMTPVFPDTDKYYQVHVVGSLLNYFTTYGQGKDCEYMMGTSFATLPFIFTHKVIQHFHSIDTGSYQNVLDSLRNSSNDDRLIVEKWLKNFEGVFEEDLNQIVNRQSISQATESFCASNSQKIIAVSPEVKKQLIKLFGIKASKIDVILNGIPDYWFELSKNEFSETADVLFPTRINYTQYTFLEKGQDRAFEILSRIKNNKKVFVNFGTLKEELRIKYQQVITNKTKSSLNSGLDRLGLQAEYKPGQIFLSTSRTEACQLTLIEAMASKMCPVTYGVGIAPDVIKNGVNGYVVNSVNQAVEIINELSKNPQKRQEIGLNAFKTANKQFRFDRMIGQYKNVLLADIK